MPILTTHLDPRSPSYSDNRAAMLARLTELDSALGQAVSGGGDKYVTRHHARGKLLARERVELLVDRDAPLLELAPIAGWGTEYPVGASIVTAIGVVDGVPCVIVANDPTVRGGAINPYTLKKAQRAGEIARVNGLPLIHLVESGGAELAAQAELFLPAGSVYAGLSRLSAQGVPTVAVVFGEAAAGTALLAALADVTILVRDKAKVFLAGPAEVRVATGDETDDESLGGALMHATRSGLADYLAEDERDALRLARVAVGRTAAGLALARRSGGGVGGEGPTFTLGAGLPQPPKYDADDLLAVPSADVRVPFDPREVLARILDGSEFDEFKPAYGTGLCTGWGAIHGHPIGVVANTRGPLSTAEAAKAAQFIELANASGTPLVFLPNTTGYGLGADHARAGIITQAAAMINAVSTSRVPHLTVHVGASYGTGQYAMAGPAFDARFTFTWPNARSAVTGPAQLAGTLSLVARQAAQAKGQPYDDDADAAMRTMVEQRIEHESGALYLSGRLSDDGVIDPRDTRTVLGLCLAVVTTRTGPAPVVRTS